MSIELEKDELNATVPEFMNHLKQQNINNDSGVTTINEASELGEALKELNKADIDPTTKMSELDMRTRLRKFEISSILAIDFLVGFNLIPTNTLQLTLQKKRLAVSEAGLGRKETIELVSGKNEADAKKNSGNFAQNFKNLIN